MAEGSQLSAEAALELSEADPGVDLAMERVRDGEAGGRRDPLADTVLRRQAEKLDHEIAHLRLQSLNDRFAMILKGLGALAGVAAAAAAVALALQAARSHALIVEPFRTPPDLAQKGLDGTVLAGRVLDRLEAMRSVRSWSGRTTESYSGDGGKEVKLEIPTTGVSIGELARALKAWLGHDVHISGSIVRQGSELVVTARTGAAAASFRGPEANLDGLVERAAESIFQASQPYAYAEYLRSKGRDDEALAVWRRLVVGGERKERAWAYIGLGDSLLAKGEAPGAKRAYRQALLLNPNLWRAYEGLAYVTNYEEQALGWYRKALAARDLSGADPERARYAKVLDRVRVDELVGDYGDALKAMQQEAHGQLDPNLAFQATYYAAYQAAYLHDVAGSRDWTAQALDRHLFLETSVGTLPHQTGSYDPAIIRGRLNYWQRADLGDWNGAAAALGAINTDITSSAQWYWFALQSWALARAGRGPEAKAIADALPTDCYVCGLGKGLTAEAIGDGTAADAVFGRLVRTNPSLVRAYLYWGEVKLARRDDDGAIALFRAAHEKGPRFADALEAWGETLLAKGLAREAAEKFAEADRYAPKWGRNHLRWGEALARLGRSKDARAQWRIAEGMDLSAADSAQVRALLSNGYKQL